MNGIGSIITDSKTDSVVYSSEDNKVYVFSEADSPDILHEISKRGDLFQLVTENEKVLSMTSLGFTQLNPIRVRAEVQDEGED